MKFAKKVATCQGCKSPLQAGEGNLCKHCKPKEIQLMMEKQNKVNEYQKRYHRAWTQCQSCQGSVHVDVLCTSRDCPIFYLRKKVQLDLDDATKQLERFNMNMEW